MIKREGEPVDLRAEPCATDIKVADLAPHYRWVRTHNQRYTIYAGQGMLINHALVVLDRWAKPPQVVTAHKTIGIEALRDLLWH